ncbi:MAG: glycosyltransferase [Micromonosporaceae bacterium]|nr:glycosyltransferase [Micromonosporaceae bacterium]
MYFIGYGAIGLLGRDRPLPIPVGRVIAIVPAYNEQTAILHKTVRSLLAGSVVPSVIHVVDDGSAQPVVGFDHPRVVWHRQDNGGKHSAQAFALHYEAARRPFDFVVTVDSDSIVDRCAVERCLRQLSDSRVNAVTGVIHALNRSKNLITRVTDLHYVHSCVMVRCGLSRAGDIFTTSGALAVYRASMWMANLEEYVSKRIADDRHLTHIAQRTGRSVAVVDAYVNTVVPDNVPDLMRQRIRWSRDYYRCVILDIKYLRGWSFWMRSVDFVLMSIAPFFAVAAFMVFPLAQWRVPLAGVGLWGVFLYIQTSCYLLHRPGIRFWRRLLNWLLLTPVLFVFQIVIVGPAMVLSLVNLKHPSWQTRNAAKRPATGDRREAMTAGRSVWFDCLRAVAIGRVLLVHATGDEWLGWIFPSMGVMFGIAGSLMAKSLAAIGERPELMIWRRLRRLIPSVWALALFLIPVMLWLGWDGQDARAFNESAIMAWIFPLSDPPGNDWANPMTGTLWYIRTYLWLILLSTPLYAGFKRYPKAMCIAPLGLLVLGPMLHCNAWLSDATISLGTYTSCWMLGYAHRAGLLRRVPSMTIVSLAVVSFGVAAAWMKMYPVEAYAIQSSPLAQALWCIGFVLLLLRVEPPMDWLARTWASGARSLITFVNARAVTIYLWHQVAIVLSLPVLDWTQVSSTSNVTLEFLAELTIVVVFLWLCCHLVGWVEDMSSSRRGTARRGSHRAPDLMVPPGPSLPVPGPSAGREGVPDAGAAGLRPERDLVGASRR